MKSCIKTEKRYLFKYRLSHKSSFAQIAKAVRTLGYELKIDTRGVVINWDEQSVSEPSKTVFHSKGLIDERVPQWLNEELEDRGFLKPQETEI